MKRKLGVLSFAVLAVAALPAAYSHWTADRLQERQKALAGKMDRTKVAVETLGSWGNHSFTLVHREGNGEAELHETKSDILIFLGGEGSIVVGGAIPDSRRTAPHELRGSKIEGGQKQPLHAGDVVHVSPKTPHQILVEPGRKLDYYAVKVEAR